jgi:septum formation protein
MSSPTVRPKLILASRSPRRRELLAEAGYYFKVVPPCEPAESESCVDGVGPQQNAAELVARLAYQKAADVARRVGSGVIVGCDTVVECDGEILGKPTDEADARRMLTTLRGREHRVVSGLCVWKTPSGPPRVRTETTTVRLDRLTDAQIELYLASGQWQGKAGGFGYQDQLGWVEIVRGSASNVVGLPLELLAQMLAEVSQADTS